MAELTLTNPSSSVEWRLLPGKFYRVMIVILFGLYAFQLWFHAIRTSATIDEPVHILAGYLHWCGDFGFNPEHPPLLKMLATMPLLRKNLVQPPWECGSRITSKADSYFFGNLFLVQNGIDNVVIPARLSAAIMSFLLAVLIFLAASEMIGAWAGLTALTLLVFEPSLIAHGALVTTDMSVTVGFFAAVYALYRFMKIPTVIRLLTVGLTIGFTLTAKHSGIIILLVFVLILLADSLFLRSYTFEKGSYFFQKALFYIVSYLSFCLIGFILLWAIYGFRYDALPNSAVDTDATENAFAKQALGHIMALVNEARVLPESYIYGLSDIVATRNRSTIIFERFHPNGRWFYFPLTFLVKTSIALLVLLIVGLLTLKLYREYKRELLLLLLPALIYLAICLLSPMNIGVRHLLPVYPFFIVVAAAGACFWVQKFDSLKYVLFALLLFHASTALRTAPNYLAFSNEFWGGTNNSYRIFRDSNVEWQQNLKLVAEYIDRENIRDCWFAAYGSSQLAQAHQPCRLMPALLEFWYTLHVTGQIVEPVPPVIEGTVFLSVTVLPPADGAEYLPIAQTRPIAQIGGSVFVYRGRFHVPLVAALSHARRTQQLVRLKRFEEAVADGRQAVELAPDDPRTHFWLGLALAYAKHTDEARRELETAIHLTQMHTSSFHGLTSRAQQELKLLQ